MSEKFKANFLTEGETTQANYTSNNLTDILILSQLIAAAVIVYFVKELKNMCQTAIDLQNLTDEQKGFETNDLLYDVRVSEPKIFREFFYGKPTDYKEPGYQMNINKMYEVIKDRDECPEESKK